MSLGICTEVGQPGKILEPKIRPKKNLEAQKSEKIPGKFHLEKSLNRKFKKKILRPKIRPKRKILKPENF